MHLDPDSIGVSPENRDGADPYQQVLHARLTTSFANDGYDPTRHLPSIVVHYRSDEGRKALLGSNERFTEGRCGFPRIYEEKMKYGTLALSHFTLAVRCVRQGMVTPSGVNLGELLKEESKLARLAAQAAQYVVFKEETPVDAQREISQWRNPDQNSNLSFHEFALIQHIIQAARKETIARGPKLNLAPICAIVMGTSPVALTPGAVSGVARFVMQYFGSKHHDLLVELTRLHAALVDPQNFSVPATTFETLAKQVNLTNAPHFKQAIVMALWTSEGAIPRQRPAPDTAGLISATDIANVAKNELLCTEAEKFLADARSKLLPVLDKHIKPNTAKEFLMTLSTAIVRLIFSKSLAHLNWHLPKGFATCHVTREKHSSLLAGWLKSVDLQHNAGLLELAGVADPSRSDGTSEEKDEVFIADPSAASASSASSSGGPPRSLWAAMSG